MSDSDLKKVKNVSGKKLKELRQSKHLTQREVAEKLQLDGIDLSLKEISKIENNSRLIKDFELFAFAKFFKVSVDYFYENEIK